MDLEHQILQDPILAIKYEFVHKLGQGCFGKIYKVKNRQLKIFTALKLEILEGNNKRSMLQNEAEILKILQGKPFTPQFYSFGHWSLGTYIELEILVTDLNSLVEKPFSFDEISTLTGKLFQSLCILHNSNILHQDIKPQNIMLNSKGQYVFIDFGISKKLKQSITKLEVQGKRTKGFIGTPRYASIQAHKGMEQSKKDDLQSLLYNIAYIYFKKLPWLSLKVAGNKKIQEIKNTKIKTAQGVFQQMGKPFYVAFNYIRKLDHMQEPNYKYIISIFKRTHSMIVDPIKSNQFKAKLIQSQQTTYQRTEAKKLSLNMAQSHGKYLQLPFMTKQGISESNLAGIKNGNQGNLISINLMGNSMNGSKAISIRAYNQSDQITSGGDQTQQKQMNLREEQLDLQPNVPDISRFFSPLTMKNPFMVHN